MSGGAASRLVIKSASGVLASFRGSPYTSVNLRRKTYPLACDRSERVKPSLVCTSSPLCSLRPCLWNGASWRAGVGRVRTAAFLNGLRGILALLLVTMWSGQAQAESCHIAPQHAGVAFPVDRIDSAWGCRLQPIIDDFTTANKIGPIQTPLPESVYVYLLDRPPVAAALVNRLELGLYKAEARGPGLYWGDDGEGSVGFVELVYQDSNHRVYYLEGTHHSTLLPNVAGKAVVLLSMVAVKDAAGQEAVETTLVSYTRLDNRVLAGLVSLLRPLVGRTVSRKLTKGVEAVNQLGLEMRRDPDRVLFEATDPPPLPPEDVAFLKQALATMSHPSNMHEKEPVGR
ncbi:MAG: hypothetical protein LZF86_190592 [Nitrospira sp.]|nr:MAG: hypothetical protein LZF86_190592 [Nitrospira sp.]